MKYKSFVSITLIFVFLLCFFSTGISEFRCYAQSIDCDSCALEYVSSDDAFNDGAKDDLKNGLGIVNREDPDNLFIELPQKDKFDVDDLILKPIVPPFRPGFDIEDEPEIENLPSEYCMRDEYVVFAQHQDKHGYCWNFASTMAASTTLMKATNEYYDFSELWTGISCLKSSLYSKIGAGGTSTMHNKAMQKHGLMLESDLPFHESYTISNENADDYYEFYSKYANDDISGCLVSDSTTSFSRKDVDKIKNHIYNHGSIYMSFTFRTGFIERDGVYSLDPNQKNTTSNHAISVIGWDDNYEMDFYLDGSDTPTHFKGAWIVLNSYTETNGTDGISLIFYDDTNIGSVSGYKYVKDTSKSLYFYDKIESGYSYPISVKGKYCGDFTAEDGITKQQNIFYDDVDLTYSYEISNGARINGIEIYLNNKDVTHEFSVSIDEQTNRFFISRKSADYGHYKVLVRYGNNNSTDTYLNNFFVTYGLAGEKLEFDYEKNNFVFNTGKDLEYYSYILADKNYVIYTDKLSGSVSFVPIEQSVYSEENMSIPTLSYNITDGESCIVTHTIKSDDGGEVTYNFKFVYCPDTSLQTVKVYYDLGGGYNHKENYGMELAGENSDLVLYSPVREGYTFLGWYIDNGTEQKFATNDGDLNYISWEDIHHMGESPTIYASSYYKKYYNNSNTLFVYAKWEKSEYTVSWKNWDGTLIYDEKYNYAENPGYYYGEGSYPTKPADAHYTYEFAGWDAILESVKSDKTYTAVFNAIPREYTVKVGAVGNGSVTSDRVGSINYFDVRTYLFTPDIGYAVKDVRVNGVSVGAVSSFTFTDVQSDQTLEVEFEADKRDISLSVAGKGSIRSNKSLVDVPFGEDRSISFVADDGWKLECVFLDGIRVDLSDNEVLIENITDDMDLFAIFVQAENENNIGLVAAIIAVSSLAVIASVTSVIFIIKLRRISLRSKK